MEVVEIYKDIKGYEGLYQVSNLGNVKSLPRKYVNSRNAERIIKETVLKTNKKRTGYLEVSLSRQGEPQRYYLVHRLVASNFLDVVNPEKTDVNHIDGDKTNNSVSNLEWCSKSENTKHAVNNNLSGFRDSIFNNLKKINENTMYSKIVMKKGNELLEFKSVSEASELLGLKRDNITRAIRKNHRVGGWEVFGYKIANEESLNSKEQVNLVGNQS